MKNKKRKKQDILMRRLQRHKDPNSTYDILMEIKLKDKIRIHRGEKKRFPSVLKGLK